MEVEVPGNQVERALTSRESLLLRLSLVTAVWCSMTTVSHALHLGIAWARRRVERLLLLWQGGELPCSGTYCTA